MLSACPAPLSLRMHFSVAGGLPSCAVGDRARVSQVCVCVCVQCVCVCHVCVCVCAMCVFAMCVYVCV